MRSNDDPIARWATTVDAIDSAMDVASAGEVDGLHLPPAVDLNRVLPAFTAEVLAHTWDLANAIGVDAHLDPELCEVAYSFMRANEDQLRSSGMFDSAVLASNAHDAATRFIALLGRDPGWTAPSRIASEQSF